MTKLRYNLQSASSGKPEDAFYIKGEFLLNRYSLSVDSLYSNAYTESKKEVSCIMDILKVFASNVKKYRNIMGLSQEAFSEKAGLHRTYISAIEREKRSIALDNVQKIADALEIETYKLFMDSDEIDKTL